MVWIKEHGNQLASSSHAPSTSTLTLNVPLKWGRAFQAKLFNIPWKSLAIPGESYSLKRSPTEHATHWTNIDRSSWLSHELFLPFFFFFNNLLINLKWWFIPTWMLLQYVSHPSGLSMCASSRNNKRKYLPSVLSSYQHIRTIHIQPTVNWWWLQVSGILPQPLTFLISKWIPLYFLTSLKPYSHIHHHALL